ncbi:hypothetical protein ACH8ZP_05460 [Chlamydia pneumoniae]|uniref:hypothetical protein n=1 Tax=Chlamydia pneumoniae TaxID=83558 RepID=UPI000320DE8B|nr:hypothetical protein [Chlamydia pneumoniae]
MAFHASAFGVGGSSQQRRDRTDGCDSTTGSDGLGEPLGPEDDEGRDEDPWSPENQRQLLQGAQKVSQLFKLG